MTTAIKDRTQSLDQLDLSQVDPGQMLTALWNLPEQCEEALRLARQAQVKIDPARVRQIMVTGLGGSAIGGDLLRVLAGRRCRVPVVVNRDYTLPAFVGPETLVFATSYSGNTEETLSACQQAVDKGAQIVAVTTGGKLGESARRDGFPIVTIPAGISPRAATGYLLIPLLAILGDHNFISPVEPEVIELTGLLRSMRAELGPQAPLAANLAKQLAGKFFDGIPVIYGAAGTTETAAMRWKGQINENAKAMAYFNVFPELNHNEVVGFEYPQRLLQERQLVILRDQDDHPRVNKRIEITREIVQGVVGGWTEIRSRGTSPLARIFSLTYIGDYTSVYLAFLNGIDPTPVKLIDLLKNKLASS